MFKDPAANIQMPNGILTESNCFSVAHECDVT